MCVVVSTFGVNITGFVSDFGALVVSSCCCWLDTSLAANAAACFTCVFSRRCRSLCFFTYTSDKSILANSLSCIATQSLYFLDSEPCTYMHLVCSGVMKRLIMCWLRGDNTVRVSARDVSMVRYTFWIYTVCLLRIHSQASFFCWYW